VIDDEGQARLRAEFSHRAETTFEPDVAAAWDEAVRLLDAAAVPQRYILGVGPDDVAPGGFVAVRDHEGRELRRDPADPRWRPLWEGQWTPPERDEDDITGTRLHRNVRDDLGAPHPVDAADPFRCQCAGQHVEGVGHASWCSASPKRWRPLWEGQ
jgi:hypothetical protein